MTFFSTSIHHTKVLVLLILVITTEGARIEHRIPTETPKTILQLTEKVADTTQETVTAGKMFLLLSGSTSNFTSPDFIWSEGGSKIELGKPNTIRIPNVIKFEIQMICFRMASSIAIAIVLVPTIQKLNKNKMATISVLEWLGLNKQNGS